MKAGETGRAHAVRSATAWTRLDIGLIAVAVIATFVLRPIHGILSRPYWFDESWPAALTRAPWSKLIGLSSSAPVSFIALVKLLPGTSDQRGRLVAIAFVAVSVASAYALTRSLEWTSRGAARAAAVVAALVVMLAPATLRRNDLKQYTADAACTLLLLAIGSSVDRKRTRKLLIALVAVAGVGITFSLTALFVAIAVFGGLVLTAVLDRAWRWLVNIAAAGAAVALLVGAYLAAVVLPHLNTALNDYWAPYYLRGSVSFMAHVSWRRLGRLEHAVAMPRPAFVAFFVIGIVALYWLRARAIAFAVPALWAEMAVMGRLEKYPFLDERTSHFLLVASLLVIAIGAVGLVFAVGTTIRRRNRVASWVVSGALALALASLFGIGVAPYVYDLHIPHEDMRAPTRYLAAHRHGDDVILVDYTASFGLGYYWPDADLTYRSNDTGQAYSVRINGIRAVYVRKRTAGGALHGLERAVRMWRAAPANSRLFIVRTHVDNFDVKNWKAAFAAEHVNPRPLHVGEEPLLVVTKH